MSSSEKGFKVLDHMADEYLMAYGSSIEEAFESAALAMFEVMTDTGIVEPKVEEVLKLEAGDEIGLLYSWLECLLIKFDGEGKLYSRFKVHKIIEINHGFSLEASIWGEDYNSEKHCSKTDIKAVTYYMMEILKEQDKVTVKFVLDI